MSRRYFHFTAPEREKIIFMLNDYAEMLDYAILGDDSEMDRDTIQRQEDARKLARAIEAD